MAARGSKGKGGGRPHGLSNRPALGIAARRMERHDAGPYVRAHPHPVHFAGACSWAAFVALVATLLIRHNDLATATNWRIVGWSVLVALAGFVTPALRWRRTWLALDGTTLRCTGGLLRRWSVALDLERAHAVGVEHGLLGGLLGYGRLRVVDEHNTPHLFPPVSDGLAREVAAGWNRRSRPRRGERRDG
jgi:hypothetical protein